MRAILGAAAVACALVSAFAGEVAVPIDRVDPAIAVPDIHGREQYPFRAASKAALVFFITTDCPISNSYAREMRRICEAYASGVACALDYVDPTLAPSQAAKHYEDYGHAGYPAIIDTRHILVKAAGAAVTPEAVLVLPGGRIAYRGRIDDRNVSIGRVRPHPTRLDLRAAIDAVMAGRPVEVPRTTPVGCYITPLELFRKLQ